MVRGYKLIRDFKMAGGGNCEWTFATKDGKEYFIKRFLNPKYPKPDGPGSEKIKNMMREACEQFESHQRLLNEAVKKVAGESGRLVAAHDFFREDNLFYKVARKVPAENIAPFDIAKLPLDNKMRLLQNVCTAVSSLHSAKIVHGDLKVDNALLEKSSGDEPFIARLIDFDSSYFNQEPPIVDEMMGDPPYYSPELLNYVQGKDTDRTKMTTQSDIFALGLVFHQYLTGKMPSFDGDYAYLCEAVRAGYVVAPDSLDKSLPEGVLGLIASMLRIDSKDRPTAFEVNNQLREIRARPDSVPSISTPPKSGARPPLDSDKAKEEKPMLRGTGMPKPESSSDKSPKSEGVSKSPLKISLPKEKEMASGESKLPEHTEASLSEAGVKESVSSKIDLDLSPTYKVAIEKLAQSLSALDTVVNAKISPPSAPTRIKGTMMRVVSKLSDEEAAGIEEIKQGIAGLKEHADALSSWLKGLIPERPVLKIFVSDHVVEVFKEDESVVAVSELDEKSVLLVESITPVVEEKSDDREGESSAEIGEIDPVRSAPLAETYDGIKTPDIPKIEVSEPESSMTVDESGSTRRMERLKSRGGLGRT